MTLDLSKTRVGDTVKFRCGGEATVSSITNPLPAIISISYELPDNTLTCARYLPNGFCTETFPQLDIISITPKPFDWKDVKAGMAFKPTYNGTKDEVWWIVGKRWNNEGYVVTRNGQLTNSDDLHFGFPEEHKMVRAPEHDIQL